MASAERARKDAQNDLNMMKEDAAANLKDAMEAETTRQEVKTARRVEAAEREARVIEEQRIKEARDAREVAVEAEREAADNEAREELAGAERTMEQESLKNIEKAEDRLRDASAQAEKAAADLRALTSGGSGSRQKARGDSSAPARDKTPPPATATKAAARPPRNGRDASEGTRSGSSRGSERSYSDSGASRSRSRSDDPGAPQRRRTGDDSERKDGAGRDDSAPKS